MQFSENDMLVCGKPYPFFRKSPTCTIYFMGMNNNDEKHVREDFASFMPIKSNYNNSIEDPNKLRPLNVLDYLNPKSPNELSPLLSNVKLSPIQD
jgi:hypothetical protein